MKQLITLLLLGIVITFISGCYYVMPRQVPKLGISSDTKECPDGEHLYYYRDADAAICLPDIMAIYTHCVTELTVANLTSNLSLTGITEISDLLKAKGITLTADEERKLEKVFVEDGGIIATARANAIKTCKDITLIYVIERGGNLFKDIEALEDFLKKIQTQEQ